LTSDTFAVETTYNPRGNVLMRLLRPLFATLILLVAVVATLAAHDMFLKPERFSVPPNTTVRVRVLNGTFTSSENTVTKDRLRDLTVVTPAAATHPDTSTWKDAGDTSILTVRTAASGTYAIGASLFPRTLRLEAKLFNEYLESDGIPDVLEARRRGGELGKAARERYSKHVKALLQVGDTRSDGYAHSFGYPAELVPQQNPYTLSPGGTLSVRADLDGKPSANELVVAGGRTTAGARIAQQSVRTDASGIATIRLTSAGQWYVKFIHMVPVRDSVDYESKWATLTFGVASR
jgi:uncharacterized GH25 family protein